jgi:hypothetical protein
MDKYIEITDGMREIANSKEAEAFMEHVRRCRVFVCPTCDHAFFNIRRPLSCRFCHNGKPIEQKPPYELDGHKDISSVEYMLNYNRKNAGEPLIWIKGVGKFELYIRKEVK